MRGVGGRWYHAARDHQIPANLAEACGRNGDAEFARFCSIAVGSASELEYLLLLAQNLKPIKPKDHAELSQRATELKRMLTALLHYAECRTMPNRFP